MNWIMNNKCVDVMCSIDAKSNVKEISMKAAATYEYASACLKMFYAHKLAVKHKNSIYVVPKLTSKGKEFQEGLLKLKMALK